MGLGSIRPVPQREIACAVIRARAASSCSHENYEFSTKPTPTFVTSH
jgi:hypothetical protein